MYGLADGPLESALQLARSMSISPAMLRTIRGLVSPLGLPTLSEDCELDLVSMFKGVVEWDRSLNGDTSGTYSDDARRLRLAAFIGLWAS